VPQTKRLNFSYFGSTFEKSTESFNKPMTKKDNIQKSNYISYKVKRVDDKDSRNKITDMIDKYLHLVDTP